LYELATTFNRFYESNRVIGDSREAVRLELVEKYVYTLSEGLSLLGIQVLDKM
jgi:arginyl-tRNA synthetase